MDTQNEYRQPDQTDDGFDPNSPYPVVIKPFHFILLSVATLGLYNVWWQYKCWKYFKEKENLDIYPALRAIFFLFFGISLFDKIADYCHQIQHDVPYNSTNLWLACIGINLLSRLPSPYLLISILAFLPLLPPVKAFNFYFTGNDNGYRDDKLNDWQTVLIVLGGLGWLLLLTGLFWGKDMPK